MNIFKKAIKEAEEFTNLIESSKETPPTPEPEEEWVWVEGYKGTNKDMQCNGYQYELGKQHNMPDDSVIEECKNGFHLCLNLSDVFKYYKIGNGHRFFKVKALVRKTNKEQYGKWQTFTDSHGYTFNMGHKYDKVVSKSIIFLSELTIDEILQYTEVNNLSTQYKQMAIDNDIHYAIASYQNHTLIEDGYSESFAAHIMKSDKFDIAHAVGSQKDLSMDMKVLAILYET